MARVAPPTPSIRRSLSVARRTHAGILDAASSITAVLNVCFPHMLDKLPRERAFFPGPRPLLLGGLNNMDDLSILLSSDPGSSAVEWGAHQASRAGQLAACARYMRMHARGACVWAARVTHAARSSCGTAAPAQTHVASAPACVAHPGQARRA